MTKLTQDQLVSQAVNDLRSGTLSLTSIKDSGKCPTCMCVAAAPFRAHDERGTIVAGCIDPHHTFAILSGASRAWHDRRSAKAWRAYILQDLRAMTPDREYSKRVKIGRALRMSTSPV